MGMFPPRSGQVRKPGPKGTYRKRPGKARKGGDDPSKGRKTPTTKELASVAQMQLAMVKIGEAAKNKDLLQGKLKNPDQPFDHGLLLIIGQPAGQGRPGRATPTDGVWGKNTNAALVELNKLAANMIKPPRGTIHADMPGNPPSFRNLEAADVIKKADENVRALVSMMKRLNIPVPGDLQQKQRFLHLDSIDYDLTEGTASADYTYGKLAVMYRNLRSLPAFYSFVKGLNVAYRKPEEEPKKEEKPAEKKREQEPKTVYVGERGQTTLTPDEQRRQQQLEEDARLRAEQARRRTQTTRPGPRRTFQVPGAIPRGAADESVDIAKLAQTIKAANIIRLAEDVDEARWAQGEPTAEKPGEKSRGGIPDMTVGEFERALDWFRRRANNLYYSVVEEPYRRMTVVEGEVEEPEEPDPVTVRKLVVYKRAVDNLRELWDRRKRGDKSLSASNTMLNMDIMQGRQRGVARRYGPGEGGFSAGWGEGEGDINRWLRRGPLSRSIENITALTREFAQYDGERLGKHLDFFEEYLKDSSISTSDMRRDVLGIYNGWIKGGTAYTRETKMNAYKWVQLFAYHVREALIGIKEVWQRERERELPGSQRDRVLAEQNRILAEWKRATDSVFGKVQIMTRR